MKTFGVYTVAVAMAVFFAVSAAADDASNSDPVHGGIFLGSNVFGLGTSSDKAAGGRTIRLVPQDLGLRLTAATPPVGTLGTSAASASQRKTPQLGASYTVSLSEDLNFHVFGGWQYYTLVWHSPNKTGESVRNEEDVSAYMIGAGADFGVGPFSLKPQLSWFKNGETTDWINPTPGARHRLVQQMPFGGGALNEAVDADSLMAMLAIEYQPTESLGLEAGIGYQASESDAEAAVAAENTYLDYYLQFAFTMAPGVYLVPEVGFRDYGHVEPSADANQDHDNLWYTGLKWQIDF
jgi:hypothetical protein